MSPVESRLQGQSRRLRIRAKRVGGVPTVALRMWLCGGRVDIVPCSHIGHIFRTKAGNKARGMDSGFPFDFGPQGQGPVVWHNAIRLVEVWLTDRYKQFFYKLAPWASPEKGGDVSSRLALKKSLGCNDFDWFVSNIYPKLLEQLDSDGRAY